MANVPATIHKEPTVWGPSWPVTTVTLFQMAPRPNTPRLIDEGIYLGTLQGVRRGVDFYRAQNDMFNSNPGRWNTYSPLTYRQPLLTYLWLALGSGAVIGFVYGVLAGISMLAAYSATTPLLRPASAILTPFALGVVYTAAIIHPPRVLYTEMWAAPMVVIAGALCALVLENPELAYSNSRRAKALSALGATSALFAMATRELSAIPVLIMLAALSFDRVARARRLWIPWAGSLLVWAALYAVHAARVQAVSQGDPAPPITQGGLLVLYFHPGLAFLSACVRWVSTTAALVPVVMLFCMMAVAGAWTLRKTRLRVLVGGMTLGLLALLVLTGTPGTYQDGSYTGYWGFLFLPPIIAWAAQGLRLVPGSSLSRGTS